MKSCRTGYAAGMGLCAVLCLSGCATVGGDAPSTVSAGAQNLAPLHDEALALVRKYQISPLRAARMLAYLNANAVATYRNLRDEKNRDDRCVYGGQLVAGFAVLAHFFPLETPGRLLSRPALLSAVNRVDCRAAFKLAELAAKVMIDQAMRDGANPPRKIRPQPSRELGKWVPTPPIFAIHPTEPFAGEWKTLAIGDPAALRLPKPPDVTSTEYQESLDEVVRMTGALTDSQKEIALRWNLDVGTVTPTGVWNLLLRRIAVEERLSDERSLALLSTAHIAMYDALIACWYFKYVHWTERPITAALRQNKSELKAAVITPPFPAYPSGHACASGAAAQVIAFFVPSRAAEVKLMADEAAESRIFGGIHFRFDSAEGLRLGEQVADKVLAQMAGQVSVR